MYHLIFITSLLLAGTLGALAGYFFGWPGTLISAPLGLVIGVGGAMIAEEFS